MGQRAARQQQKLQRVVKHRAVAAVLVNDGKHVFQPVAKQVGMQIILAGVHALLVAVNGVDFAVVDGIPVGMRPFPAGEGVGGIAAVHQRDGRIKIEAGQVKV